VKKYADSILADWCIGRDRIVVSTSRCGRDNPGSNPGHGRAVSLSRHDQSHFKWLKVSCVNKRDAEKISHVRSGNVLSS
jgi:hypothetical protein